MSFSEEDIKRLYITPALKQSGWDGTDVIMEYSYTLGSISLTNNKISRRNDNKKCDYILCYKGRKIAVVEAKKQKLGIADGIQQAIDYARDLHLNFAYSSNGEGFVEHDFLTGKEKNS